MLELPVGLSFSSTCWVPECTTNPPNPDDVQGVQFFGRDDEGLFSVFKVASIVLAIVPEPAPLVLFGLALGSLAFLRRRETVRIAQRK